MTTDNKKGAARKIMFTFKEKNVQNVSCEVGQTLRQNAERGTQTLTELLRKLAQFGVADWTR